MNKMMRTLPLALLFAACAAQASDAIEARLKNELAILGYPEGRLPEMNAPFGNYADGVQSGSTLFLTSVAPMTPGGQWIKGRVPDQIGMIDAVIAAKIACARQVARIKRVLGSLDRVKRIAYVRVKVLSQPDFTDHGKIADACSGIFTTAFGDAGKHARTTEGVTSNPYGVTLEVETFVDVKPDAAR